MSRGISNLGGGGGLTQEEHDALMSIASMPARGDVNPGKLSNIQSYIIASSKGFFPIIGYDKIAIKKYQNTSSMKIQDANEVDLAVIDLSATAVGNWTDYVTIPTNAVYLRADSSSAGTMAVVYSLLTKDSPYNPDNQTP